MKQPITASIALFATLAIIGTLLAGCPRQAPRPRATSTTSQPGTTSTTTKGTTTTKATTTITLYFINVRDGVMFLVPERRTIPKTSAIARASLEELIKGPKQAGLTSVIPRDTKVRSVKITDSLATIDFSREVLNANVGAESEALGIAQIVDTLTQFPTIKTVKFLVEGRDRGTIDGRQIEDWWGHVGLSKQPFSRNESVIQGARIRTNTITVNSPRAYTEIPNPVTVEGTATVFEASLNVRILDRNNNRLADIPVMAENFMNGPFKKSIKYRQPSAAGRGTVLFYFISPKDGSEVTMATVTVFLNKTD
ncbi:MAG: GerMN domain-containing protein [Firmicutes bacterium]|nr:GerMN domain-containing protein [Bacillota bacterium]